MRRFSAWADLLPSRTPARYLRWPTTAIPTANRAVYTAAEAAGQAAGGLVNVLDPEVLVVSGGLADAGELWWKPMKAALRRELLDPLVRVPVLRASLANSAAIVGAARLVFN